MFKTSYWSQKVQKRLSIYVGMIFSMKYLFSYGKIKSAAHNLIKSCLVPNFFWKNRFFYVSRAPQSQGMMGVLSDTKISEADFHLPGNNFCGLYLQKVMFKSRICYVHGVLKNWQNLSFYDGFWKMLDFAIKIEFHGATLISPFSSILKIWI